VVALMAALFTLLGLNLAGLFEFGNLLPGRLAGWQAKNPTVNAFLSGVLATAIASPCTAPFMGASLGYAVGLPALEALAIFAAMGVGMALPYLAASAIPAVARALPRPGPWMVTFKQLMAFPMFATVAWLVWVLGQQSGVDGAGALLALLVLMALVIWAFTCAARRARCWRLFPSRCAHGACGRWARTSPGRWPPCRPHRRRRLAGLGAGPG
jgi:thiol:disulfide interchange protein